MKLENTSMKKEKTKRKSNQELVDKESFAITNKTKGSSNQSRLKDKSFNNKSNNKSQPTLSEEDDTEFSSDEPKQPIFKKKNINYQKIPSFLHIPKSIWRGYVESMRLLVAEKLYPLCPTTEYRDMPINEINKCIDKFHKKNPSFPETVGDWAEHEMIRRHINYRQSLLVSNSPNIESLERLDNNKSLPSKKEAIEDVEVVRIPPAKRPGRKRKITQPSDDEKGVEDVETIRISPAKHPGRKTKAAQPPDDEKGVEDAETIRIPPAKRPGRKCKAV
ncbi:unnamed protein product [Rhizophagus irregularis]|nr:unnamed protein product [Rhizophagus irregularis]